MFMIHLHISKHVKAEPITPLFFLQFLSFSRIQSYIPATSSVEYVMVHYTGQTSYYEPVIYKSSCQMNLWHFPYDTQNCQLTWGSWGYSSDLLQLVSTQHCF